MTYFDMYHKQPAAGVRTLLHQLPSRLDRRGEVIGDVRDLPLNILAVKG